MAVSLRGEPQHVGGAPYPSFSWPRVRPLNLSREMQSRSHHPYFADEETKAQGIYKHSQTHRLLSRFFRI